MAPPRIDLTPLVNELRKREMTRKDIAAFLGVKPRQADTRIAMLKNDPRFAHANESDRTRWYWMEY